MTDDRSILTRPLQVERDAHRLTLSHPCLEVIWELAHGGRMVYLKDRRNGVVLLDARAGGPGPDLLIAASATLEEDYHEIRMSDFPA